MRRCRRFSRGVDLSVRTIAALVLACFGFAANADEAEIVSGVVVRVNDNPHAEMSDPNSKREIDVEFWVQWKNAWRNARNHDAVWVVVKAMGLDAAGEPVARHAKIVSVPKVVTGAAPTMEVRMPADATGFFVQPARAFRGDIRVKVSAKLDPQLMEGIVRDTLRVNAVGFEMVYIPRGAFHAGAAAESELRYGAFHRSNASGGFTGPVPIRSEDAIEVGAAEGALNYRTLKTTSYLGDGKGPVPAAFPKGFRAFYAMKYELTQGEYAAFLNGIDGYGADTRANFAGPTYYADRGTIRLQQGVYVAERPRRPANFVGWEDGIAFLDWAALRPMTELEFEKAARGPRVPQPGEYVWGTADTHAMRRGVRRDGDVGPLDGSGDEGPSEQSALRVGASHYWVMDLSGSLWERVVSIGDAAGRAFTGLHGDGDVNAYGDADVPGWPRELGSPRREKGFGYRGGGFYRHDEVYDAYRPHSPVSFRPYGSWSGGPRHRAYGFRGVRTAEW